MTFTGQSGAGFDRGARFGTWELLRGIEDQTGGALRADDFVSLPSAHPLCYLVTYVLRLEDGTYLPFPRFMSGEDLRGLLAKTLYLLPGRDAEARFGAVIDRLWSDRSADERVLAALKRMITRLFDPDLDEDERLRVAEEHTKAIYVHSHMDEETFDTDRIRRCCVGMPAADGTSVPSCAYNILYRERDARFIAKPREPLVQLGVGRGVIR
jgi:uncharacterized radical SAM superfamily Fe-S cluster-containing enzyme